MKKLLLFITVALLGVSMSSCLDMGSQQFNDRSIVYISQYQGRIYGKTLSGRVITSDKMQIMSPRSFKLFSFSWDESYGYTPIGDLQANNVVITGDEIDIASTELWDIPADSETAEYKFKQILSPAHDPYGKYFDDFWLFEYHYRALEGEKYTLEFYTREYDESEKMLLVDIRLFRTEVGKENASEKDFFNIMAVDMGQLRRKYFCF